MGRSARSVQGLQYPIYKVVGNNIEKFRNIRGFCFSQGDLALITGYNRAFIRNMENGQQRIHLDTVALLAQSLDVPFYVFLRIPMLSLDIGKRSIFELKQNIKS
jgi:transcriptional regulator with XRE-family HTH domain